MRRVHRFRKMFGGGMRQAGILAAAAEYALEHNVDRLADDHANARRLAEALAEMPSVSIDLDTVETNILFFDLDESVGTAADFTTRLRGEGVWMLPTAPQRVRAVTHLDVDPAGIDRAVEVLRRLLTK
jgi:threonine aldolase